MRVLVLHNRYRQHGGEDGVADSEIELLRSRGVDVRALVVDNEISPEGDLLQTLQLGWNSSWSHASYRKVHDLCHEFRPDVAHVHNFWLRLSPSVHAACRDAGVPTIQTLHNFRLFCLNGLYKREGRICEDCLGKAPWRGVVRRCYRDSFVASSAMARMIVRNRLRGTWDKDVSAFIALSEHSRLKFIAGGIAPGRLYVKPNFVNDPGSPSAAPSTSNTVLFAGRLSEEKGVDVLISAWAHGQLSGRARLVIVGDGPEREALERQASALGLGPSAVSFLGRRAGSEVISLMRTARVVAMPSIFFECFPRTLVEAYASGRGVVVSQIGALSEIVSRQCGLTFPARDYIALAEALQTVIANDQLADNLGRNARADYLARYTAEENYRLLMGIYRRVIEQSTEEVLSEQLADSRQGSNPGRQCQCDQL